MARNPNSYLSELPWDELMAEAENPAPVSQHLHKLRAEFNFSEYVCWREFTVP